MSKESNNLFHISIELLRALERKAKQSNIPVKIYIEEIIKTYILNESNLDKQSINDERFNQAENLGKDNKKQPIQKINKTNKSDMVIAIKDKWSLFGIIEGKHRGSHNSDKALIVKRYKNTR